MSFKSCFFFFFLFTDHNGIQALDGDDSDGFFRQNRQFYRFGRAFAPLWDNIDDSLARKNRLLHWSAYPMSSALDDDVFSRNSRQFYRFGRAYPPYQDKRFLRFGRSPQSDVDEYIHLLHNDQPLYRKRRSQVTDAKEDSLQRIARSAESNQQSVNKDMHKLGKDLQKREASKDNSNINDHLSQEIVSNEDKDLEKRFMRFGKRFMRFGRGDEDESYDKRFMRFGKSLGDDQSLEKRFMRFGKRFMRFGRGDEDDSSEEKRFMRFGKSGNEDGDLEKRFMRFGKRFMRFGRGDTEDDNDNFGKDIEDKRFMRFGKRSRRSPSFVSSSDSDAASVS